MATSSFDKVFVVKGRKAQARLKKILSTSGQKSDITETPTTPSLDWEKSEEFIQQCFSLFDN